jgi:hypothetical protein
VKATSAVSTALDHLETELSDVLIEAQAWRDPTARENHGPNVLTRATHDLRTPVVPRNVTNETIATSADHVQRVLEETGGHQFDRELATSARIRAARTTGDQVAHLAKAIATSPTTVTVDPLDRELATSAHTRTARTTGDQVAHLAKAIATSPTTVTVDPLDRELATSAHTRTARTTVVQTAQLDKVSAVMESTSIVVRVFLPVTATFPSETQPRHVGPVGVPLSAIESSRLKR